MELVGTSFQDVAAAVRGLHGPTSKWFEQLDLVGADELTDYIMVLTDKTCLLISAHD
jgi:hypothetical protein